MKLFDGIFAVGGGSGMFYEVGARAVANPYSGPVADLSLHVTALAGNNASESQSSWQRDNFGDEFALPDAFVRLTTDYMHLDIGQKYIGIDGSPLLTDWYYCMDPGLDAPYEYTYTPNSATGAFATFKPFQLMDVTFGVVSGADPGGGGHGAAGYWATKFGTERLNFVYSGLSGQVGEEIYIYEEGPEIFRDTVDITGTLHRFGVNWRVTDRLGVGYGLTLYNTEVGEIENSVLAHLLSATWRVNDQIMLYSRWQYVDTGSTWVGEWGGAEEIDSEQRWGVTMGASRTVGIFDRRYMRDNRIRIIPDLEVRGEITYQETEARYGGSESETIATIAIIAKRR